MTRRPKASFFILPLILFSILSLFLPVPVGAAAVKPDFRLCILYFNDFHGALDAAAKPEKDGAVGGAARLVKLVKDIQKANEKAGIPTLVFNSGDFVQGQPLSNAGQGAVEAAMFNMMGLSAYCLGNHELDFGPRRLMALVGEIKAPCVTANLSVSGQPVGAPRMFTVGNIRVGVAGLVAADDFSVESPTVEPSFLKDVKVSGETAQARAIVADLRSRGSDFVVFLTHFGDKRDRRLAEKVSGIDVICGAHSHTAIPGAVKVGRTHIVQAGSYGKYLGRMDVEFLRKRPARVSARLIPVTVALSEDPEMARLIAQKKEAVPDAENEVLAQNRCLLKVDARNMRTGETPAGNLVADAMRFELRADAAMINGGAIRAALPAGPVTLAHVKAFLPFAQSPTHLVSITGAELANALHHGAKQAGKGGFPQVSGLSFTLVPLVGAFDVKVGDEPLDNRKVYTLAVNSFIATGGDGYTVLRDIPAERRSVHPTAALLLARHLKTRYGQAGQVLDYCEPQDRIRLPLSASLGYSGMFPWRFRGSSFFLPESMAKALIR